jgi:tripartite-type tricarboxylate transporter receptor subunit TctC
MSSKSSGASRHARRLGSALLLLIACGFAHAYPDKPIRLLVAFAPGGGSDTSARIMASKLTEALGQQVIVDNRPGAAGNIATEIAVGAKPDGYTLLWGFSSPLVVNPSLYKLPFDTEKDLVPISLVAESQYMLVIHPSIKASSVKDLVALAKARAGQLNYASAGNGTPHHLSAELFKKAAGIEIVQVTYKGGGPAAIAVLSGEVSMHFGSFASSLSHVRAGKLRALAVTGPKRSAEAPDLPTMQELGFPGFDVRTWFGVLAPRATPRDIVTRLNREILRILAMPDVEAGHKRIGLDTGGNSPEEFAAHIRAEKAFWAKFLRETGITAQ